MSKRRVFPCAVHSRNRTLTTVVMCVLLLLGVSAVGADDDDGSDDSEAAERPKLHVGGALRFNAFYKSWDE